MTISIEDAIHKLNTYNNSSYKIISLFLDISPENGHAQLVNKFQQLLSSKISPKERHSFDEDIDYITAFLSQYKNTHQYHGLGIFSGGNKLWDVINTPFEIENGLFIDHSPILDPFVKKLATYQRYLVILADREKARMFTIYKGAVEEEQTIKDPSVPQNVRANEEAFYGRGDKISRHIQDHLHRHMKLISEKVNEFVRNKSIAGVIVGGHNTLIHKTELYLPQQLRKKVVAEFISELNISLTQIAQDSIKIIEKINKGLQPGKRYPLTILNHS